MDDFGASRTAILWDGNVCVAVTSGGGVFASKIMARFGIKRACVISAVFFLLGFGLTSFANQLWHIYIGIGYVLGIASCIAYTATTILTVQYFNKYRGVAIGLGASGVGVGMLVGPYIASAMLDHYSWRAVFRIQAGYSSALMLLAAFVLRPPRKPSSLSSSEDSSYVELVGAHQRPIKDWHFHRGFFQLVFDKLLLIYGISRAIFSISAFVPRLYTVSLGEDYATLVEADAEWTLTVLLVFNIVGRIAVGPVCDWAYRHNRTLGLYILTVVMVGLTIAVFPAIRNYNGLALLGAFYGFSYGASAVVVPFLVLYCVDIKDFPRVS
jgi:MFS family permease